MQSRFTRCGSRSNQVWRRIAAIVGCFAVGVLLSLLTAWGTALYVGLPNNHIASARFYGAEANGRQWATRLDFSRFGVVSGYSFFGPWQPPPGSDPSVHYGGEQDLPSWSRGRRRPDASLPVYVKIFETACGWPVTAWKGEFRTTNDHHIPLRTSDGTPWWSLVVAIDYSQLGDRVVILPLRPIFPGVIWSVLIYAGAVYFAKRLLVFVYDLVVRRPIRAFRRLDGLCERCGYELRGLPRCPECGSDAREERDGNK